MSDLKKLLLGAAPEVKLRENVPYREITTIGVGSTLPLLAEISSVEMLKNVLKALKGSSYPFFILGAGSNLIGMDAPYPGAALCLDRKSFGNAEFSGVFMKCGGALRLSHAARLTAAGGQLVYSPCSIEPEENGSLIDGFLTEHPEFVQLCRQTVLPDDKSDGCSFALLKKAKK